MVRIAARTKTPLWVAARVDNQTSPERVPCASASEQKLTTNRMLQSSTRASGVPYPSWCVSSAPVPNHSCTNALDRASAARRGMSWVGPRHLQLLDIAGRRRRVQALVCPVHSSTSLDSIWVQKSTNAFILI